MIDVEAAVHVGRQPAGVEEVAGFDVEAAGVLNPVSRFSVDREEQRIRIFARYQRQTVDADLNRVDVRPNVERTLAREIAAQQRDPLTARIIDPNVDPDIPQVAAREVLVMEDDPGGFAAT